MNTTTIKILTYPDTYEVMFKDVFNRARKFGYRFKVKKLRRWLTEPYLSVWLEVPTEELPRFRHNILDQLCPRDYQILKSRREAPSR